jgi:predicted membrane metal-binding protein
VVAGARPFGVFATLPARTKTSRRSFTVGAGRPVPARISRAELARLGAGRDPSPQRALVAGVTLGDTSGMTLADRESFRASGLFHLVSVDKKDLITLVAFVTSTA